MALVDHVKNSGGILEIASGLHLIEGDLIYSRVDAGRVYIKHALGDGEWNQIIGIWFRGLAIPDADWHFHPGTLSTGGGDPLQGVCSYFPTGLTHSGTACVCARLPAGVPDLDTAKTAPEGLRLVCETEKSPDFNSLGNIVGFNYSTNPARCLVGSIMRLGKIKTGIADTERYFSQYWKNRIHWGAWLDWRDSRTQTETVDYRQLDGFDGFGLTASWFDSTDLTRFVAQFVQPALNFPSSSAPIVPDLKGSSFSALFEGYIKFPYGGETFRLSLTHDDGARVYIGEPDGEPEGLGGSGIGSDEFNGESGSSLLIDQWTDTGTHTANFTPHDSGSFYPIRVEWRNTAGAGQLKLEWLSDSQSNEVIPSEAFYPKAAERPIYESHIRFTQNTSLGKVIRDYLRVSNSGRQDIDGKMKFFALETVAPEFAFNADNILDLKVRQRDVRDYDLQNVFEAKFRNTDLQYLQEATVQVQMEDLQQAAGKIIKGAMIDFPNMTPWQAYKLLKLEADYAVRNLNRFEINANALAYAVMPYDRVYLNSAEYNFVNKPCVVEKAVDKSIEETADDKFFVLKEV